MTRASGVLLNLSSLPGPFGIGCFGEEALHFAALLRSAGCAYWQVLPFTQTGECNSPYQSYSAFAWVRKNQRRLLKKAYSNISGEIKTKTLTFSKENS